MLIHVLKCNITRDRTRTAAVVTGSQRLRGVLLNCKSRWCVSDPLARFARAHILPLVRGRAAEGGRGSLTHHLECEFCNTPTTGCSLWPPNHRLLQVATVTTTDPLSGLVPGSLKVTGVSNEPSSNPNDPEIVITPNGSGGFIYTLNATAMGSAGSTATATATCTVPRDIGRTDDKMPCTRLGDSNRARGVRSRETTSQNRNLSQKGRMYLIRSTEYFQWQLSCFVWAHAERHPLRHLGPSTEPGLCIYGDHFDRAGYRRKLLHIRLH